MSKTIQRARTVAAIAAFGTLLSGFSGCPQTLTATLPAVDVGRASETSVASQTIGLLTSTVVAFNDRGAFGSSHSGWAYFDNFHGDVRCDFAPSSTATGCRTIPLPSSTMKWAGDPTVVADGRGNVVYVTLLDETDNTYQGPVTLTRWVVALVSTDGGQSFGDPLIINGDDCNGGEVDQPTADFDRNISPQELHIAWRFKSKWPGTTYGGCYRGGMTIRNGQLHMPYPTHGIDNMFREYNFPDTRGQGGLVVRARGGHATVGFQAADYANCGDPIAMSWGLVHTDDYGGEWSDHSDRINHTPNFPLCVLTGDAVHQVGIRAFDMAREVTGRTWILTQGSKDSLSLAYSDDQIHVNDLGAIFRPIGEGQSVLHPSIAVDSSNHVVVSYYTSDSTDMRVARVAGGSANPAAGADGNWGTVFLESFGAALTDNTDKNPTQRELGDYDGISVNEWPGSSEFHLGWSAATPLGTATGPEVFTTTVGFAP